ncbi:erythromycin esterase family protein [Actinomadura sp. 9N407]|uniref:erythromycin esterase family protein n=1 Tax=Actinomadura sp. 9N407 TaxID=3375154 RepID=UPI0037A10DE4
MTRQNDAGRAAATRWISGRAHPLDAPEAGAPLTDLEPLRALAADATVVGMGASTRGAREVSVLQHRVARFLVEELGYRTLALEEDWTRSLSLDAYVRTGEGDPRELLAEMWLPWRTREILDVITWMREFNERHPNDPVRFVGIDFTGIREVAYDTVTEYVRRAAPDRLPELDAHYAPLRPTGEIDEHVGHYRSLPDKAPHIAHAERAYELAAALPPTAGRDVALQQARAVVDFHIFHSRPIMEALPYAERRMAENLLWWHQYTGSKVVYWGGTAHSAPGRSIGDSGSGDSGAGNPGNGDAELNTGGTLRRHLGKGYLSMGVTFGQGAVHGGVPVPPPPGDYADSVLDTAATTGHYLVDLRDPGAAPEVTAWLNAPSKLRVIGPGYRPEDDADHHMAGGTVAGWLDVAVHSREVTPSRPG